MTGALIPCPSCGTPFEPGEDVCVYCLTALTVPLEASRSLRDHYARLRATRIVATATSAIYLGCSAGVLLVQFLVMRDSGLHVGRDLYAGITWAMFGAAGFAVYGIPGRTLHHYPTTAIVRRGRPHWWKGLAASAVVVAAMAAVHELIVRREWESRGAGVITVTRDQWMAAIDGASFVYYAGVAIILIWNAVAPVFGRQSLTRSQRLHLMKSQAKTVCR